LSRRNERALIGLKARWGHLPAIPLGTAIDHAWTERITSGREDGIRINKTNNRNELRLDPRPHSRKGKDRF
jgi:hypothetical protein